MYKRDFRKIAIINNYEINNKIFSQISKEKPKF